MMMMMWDIGRGRTEPYIYIYIYIYHMYMLLANFSVEALHWRGMHGASCLNPKTFTPTTCVNAAWLHSKRPSLLLRVFSKFGNFLMAARLCLLLLN